MTRKSSVNNLAQTIVDKTFPNIVITAVRRGPNRTGKTQGSKTHQNTPQTNN